MLRVWLSNIVKENIATIGLCQAACFKQEMFFLWVLSLVQFSIFDFHHCLVRYLLCCNGSIVLYILVQHLMELIKDQQGT